MEFVVGLEDGDFDAVVAHFLDLLERGHQTVVQVVGPEEQVHAEFHVFCPQIYADGADMKSRCQFARRTILQICVVCG